MNYYLQFLYLIISHIYCKEDLKLFHEIPSEEARNNFDSFPLVSKTIRETDWCKGVEEVEEVREVNNKLYKKEYLLDNTQTRHIVDPSGGPGG